MDTSRIGPLQASRLALGSWNTYSRMEFRDVIALVTKAMDLGINTFDISHYPDAPHSEVVFGRVLRELGRPRESFLVQEKVWLSQYPALTLREQLERSLDRLDLERVDIVMSEYPNASAPLERLVDELADLVESGLTSAWGALNWSSAELRAAADRSGAAGRPGPVLLQLKYSAARRHVVDDEYDAVLDETGIALQPSDVLEGGILAGIEAPARPIGQDPGGIRQEIIERLPLLRELAASVGSTPAQLCIAFALANPHTATVLFGSRRISTLEENVGALALLDEHGADAIRQLVEPLACAGHRADTPGGYRVGLSVGGKA
jgi:aryl-alcohol dehydrogenase-like predicted oxidoreductase